MKNLDFDFELLLLAHFFCRYEQIADKKILYLNVLTACKYKTFLRLWWNTKNCFFKVILLASYLYKKECVHYLRV